MPHAELGRLYASTRDGRLDAARREVVVGPRDCLRRHSLSLRDVNWLGDAPLEAEAPPRTDPHLRLVRQRISQRLGDALDALPTDQREAVWLIDGQGFKYGEAANILGCAPGTVASRVARGRLALKRRLRDVAIDQGVAR